MDAHRNDPAGGWRRHGWNATGYVEDDVLKDAHAITCPVLVVCGYEDYEPITQAYTVKERIAHAQHVFINECGHLPWVEQPEVFLEHVQPFLASTGDQGSAL